MFCILWGTIFSTRFITSTCPKQSKHVQKDLHWYDRTRPNEFAANHTIWLWISMSAILFIEFVVAVHECPRGRMFPTKHSNNLGMSASDCSARKCDGVSKERSMAHCWEVFDETDNVLLLSTSHHSRQTGQLRQQTQDLYLTAAQASQQF